MIRNTTIDRAAIRSRWDERGFSCDLWVDRPGQIWTDFVHDVDELVMLVDGALELELDGELLRPEPGHEILIAARTRHTVRNTGQATARWLYGYRRSSASVNE